jgi:NADPH-dependent glutamate synthase beta subunit-like oxidoreductase
VLRFKAIHVSRRCFIRTREKEVVTVQIDWQKNDKGQFVPVAVPGTQKVYPAQLVFLAMGFLGPEQMLLKDLAVETDPRSNVKADHGEFTISLKGVLWPRCSRRHCLRTGTWIKRAKSFG